MALAGVHFLEADQSAHLQIVDGQPLAHVKPKSPVRESRERRSRRRGRAPECRPEPDQPSMTANACPRRDARLFGIGGA
jgi:hypothetical protein